MLSNQRTRSPNSSPREKCDPLEGDSPINATQEGSSIECNPLAMVIHLGNSKTNAGSHS